MEFIWIIVCWFVGVIIIGIVSFYNIVKKLNVINLIVVFNFILILEEYDYFDNYI